MSFPIIFLTLLCLCVSLINSTQLVGLWIFLGPAGAFPSWCFFCSLSLCFIFHFKFPLQISGKSLGWLFMIYERKAGWRLWKGSWGTSMVRIARQESSGNPIAIWGLIVCLLTGQYSRILSSILGFYPLNAMSLVESPCYRVICMYHSLGAPPVRIFVLLW